MNSSQSLVGIEPPVVADDLSTTASHSRGLLAEGPTALRVHFESQAFALQRCELATRSDDCQGCSYDYGDFRHDYFSTMFYDLCDKTQNKVVDFVLNRLRTGHVQPIEYRIAAYVRYSMVLFSLIELRLGRYMDSYTASCHSRTERHCRFSGQNTRSEYCGRCVSRQ
jgi:hypothetical protein